jgi:hypothetical protein
MFQPWRCFNEPLLPFDSFFLLSIEDVCRQEYLVFRALSTTSSTPRPPFPRHSYTSPPPPPSEIDPMVISEGVGRVVLPTSPPERSHLAYLECQESAHQPHWNLSYTTPKGLERWAETLERWSKLSSTRTSKGRMWTVTCAPPEQPVHIVNRCVLRKNGWRWRKSRHSR